MSQFAAAVTGGDERSDFEGLLGPLDAVTKALPLLGAMEGPFGNVPLIGPPLQAATEALRTLHRLGLGSALNLIAERSHGQGVQHLVDGPGTLVTQLVELSDGDTLTIATLNYDGLLQAALEPYDDEVADLASGVGAQMTPLGGANLHSWPLRTEADFPPDRSIHLLHVHGSLGWLQLEDAGIRKFRIQQLRDQNVWHRIAQGELSVVPMVVLTDRKDDVPGTAPFDLGYSILAARLVSTRH